MRQFRIGLSTALAVYAVAMLASPGVSFLLDEFNLPVREAGQLVFAPLGGSMRLLGGIVLPILLPLLFGALYSGRRDEHAASVAAWCVGQGFSTMGLRMADAPSTVTPVANMDRDWTVLFSEWGVLGEALQFGQLAHGFGFLVMLVATFWGISEALGARNRVVMAKRRYR